jgi:phosphoglycerol transferase MdoB-like AlkP superfamily enzyme
MDLLFAFVRTISTSHSPFGLKEECRTNVEQKEYIENDAFFLCPIHYSDNLCTIFFDMTNTYFYLCIGVAHK